MRAEQFQLGESRLETQAVKRKRQRGFERSSLKSLALPTLVEDGTAVLTTGPIALGGSWLAWAAAQQVSLRGQAALHLRVPSLSEDVRGMHCNCNGGIGRWLADDARIDFLPLDSWGLAAMDPPKWAYLMEVIDGRAVTRPTIVPGQLAVEHWNAWKSGATTTDALLVRVLSDRHRLNIEGKSMRPSRAASLNAVASATATRDTAVRYGVSTEFEPILAVLPALQCPARRRGGRD